MSFPTTGTLDTCGRADENPLSHGGKWTNPAMSGDANLQLVTQTIRDTGSSGSAYWSDATFGPDSEVYAQLADAGVGGTMRLFARLTSPNSGSEDGYVLHYAYPDQVLLRRLDNGGITTLATYTQGINAADTLGMSIVGATLTAYYHNGSVWATLGSFDDSTYTGAGYLAARISGGSGIILSSFSGGTAVGGGLSVALGGSASTGGHGTGVPNFQIPL